MYNTKTIIEYETFSFIAFFFASVRSPRPSNSLLLTVTCLWSLWSRQTVFQHTGWTIKGKPVLTSGRLGLLTEEADLTEDSNKQTLNVLLLIITGIPFGVSTTGTESL